MPNEWDDNFDGAKMVPYDLQAVSQDRPYQTGALRRAQSNLDWALDEGSPGGSLSLRGASADPTAYQRDRPYLSVSGFRIFFLTPWLLRPGSAGIDMRLFNRVSNAFEDWEPSGTYNAEIRIRMTMAGFGTDNIPLFVKDNGGAPVFKWDRVSLDYDTSMLETPVLTWLYLELFGRPQGAPEQYYDFDTANTTVRDPDLVHLENDSWYSIDPSNPPVGNPAGYAGNGLTATYIDQLGDPIQGVVWLDHDYRTANNRMHIWGGPNQNLGNPPTWQYTSGAEGPSSMRAYKFYPPYMQLRNLEVRERFNHETRTLRPNKQSYYALKTPSSTSALALARYSEEVRNRAWLISLGQAGVHKTSDWFSNRNFHKRWARSVGAKEPEMMADQNGWVPIEARTATTIKFYVGWLAYTTDIVLPDDEDELDPAKIKKKYGAIQDFTWTAEVYQDETGLLGTGATEITTRTMPTDPLGRWPSLKSLYYGARETTEHWYSDGYMHRDELAMLNLTEVTLDLGSTIDPDRPLRVRILGHQSGLPRYDEETETGAAEGSVNDITMVMVGFSGWASEA